MPLRTAEAFILRTYPLKESDKIVVFFTREYGKRRGVARAASRPKSKFGSSLEPLSQVRIQYFEREGKELSNVDHCELLSSMVASSGTDLVHSVAVSLMVEVADRVLPDHEVSDPVYRLILAVLPLLRRAGPETVWLPLTYYLYWMVRLGGFLPNFTANELNPEALGLAQAISRQAAAELAEDPRPAGLAGRELRQALKASLEDHLEASLHAWPMLLGLET